MDPTEALDLHRRLLEFTRSPMGVRYLTFFIEDVITRGGKKSAIAMKLAGATTENAAKDFIARQDTILDMGETYAIADEMMDLVKFAADSMPDVALTKELMPSEFGFVVFPASTTFETGTPYPMHVRAMSWGCDEQGVFVYWFSSNEDLDMAGVHKDTVARFTPLSLSNGVPVFWNATVEDMIEKAGQAKGSLAVGRIYKLLLAFWMLSMQTVGERVETQPGRHAEKRWSRLTGRSKKTVTVVRLRRRHGQGLGESDREWHHRWVVRGHWRQQPCGPGKKGVKAIWISPYIKGPDDAPFLMNEKVNYLVR